MSQVRSEIPFMASLWIRSGCDMKVEPSVETYQVGAHFKALIKAILVAPSRILEIFFSFHVSLPHCAQYIKQSRLLDLLYGFFPKMYTEQVGFFFARRACRSWRRKALLHCLESCGYPVSSWNISPSLYIKVTTDIGQKIVSFITD